jgi:hypothetical protein
VDLHLPATLTSIGAFAFDGCSGLVELHLPDALSVILLRAFSGCTSLRCIVLPPALPNLDPMAFHGSTACLRMLVVPPAVAEGGAPLAVKPFEIENTPVLQLVSAPDPVVAIMDGKFAGMTSMTEVRAASRDVRGMVERCFWTARTHRCQVCTRDQRACAHTLLLVGARLYAQSTPSTLVAPDLSPRTVASQAVLQLPALPNELWTLVLGWLRRPELGRRR